MPKNEALQLACLEFMKFLRKKNLKEKQTILEVGKRVLRVKMFRTDNLLQLLGEEGVLTKVKEIFSEAKVVFNGIDDLPELFNTLTVNGMVLKLSRMPNKFPDDKLLKWPKKMKRCEVS